MRITSTLCLTSIVLLALSIAGPVQAQNPTQGDYYPPGQTTPQQVSPGQEQKIQQGDYYPPGQMTPQQVSPGQERKIQQGDYYKPDSK